DRVRGELERPLTAHDLDVALLERLAESVDRGARELGQLVEEQHAAMAEGDLPGQRPITAADQPGGGDGVVRRPERSRRGQPPVADPGRAVHPRDLERLLEAGWRQDAGEA